MHFLKNQTQTVRLRETELSAFTFICWVCACVCLCEYRVGVVKMCSPEFDISFTQQNHCRIPSIMLMPSYLPSTLKCKTDGIRPFLALSCQCVQRHLKHTVYIYFLHLNTRNNFLVFFLVITISGIFQRWYVMMVEVFYSVLLFNLFLIDYSSIWVWRKILCVIPYKLRYIQYWYHIVYAYYMLLVKNHRFLEVSQITSGVFCRMRKLVQWVLL